MTPESREGDDRAVSAHVQRETASSPFLRMVTGKIWAEMVDGQAMEIDSGEGLCLGSYQCGLSALR